MRLTDKDKMSVKLWKQLKALERKEKAVLFGFTLDEVAQRVNTPKKQRVRK